MNFKAYSILLRDAAVAAASAAAAMRIVMPVIVKQSSMEETLHPNDRLLVSRLAYTGAKEPARGDIIVFRDKKADQGRKKFLIKRVIGLPGETVRTENGTVAIDGRTLDEPYLNGCPTPDGEITECRVPESSFFVMGDNRRFSRDSRLRSVGCVPKERIVGKVIGVR